VSVVPTGAKSTLSKVAAPSLLVLESTDRRRFGGRLLRLRGACVGSDSASENSNLRAMPPRAS